jgi:hypothetical protein
MAATKAQGKTFSVFLVGLTTACAGLAYFDKGGGKLALIIGLALLAAGFASTLKIKPQEGKVAVKPQPTGLKLLGIALCAGGWLIVVAGINIMSATSGKLAATLVGMAVTLVGVVYVLPKASVAGAIWKA